MDRQLVFLRGLSDNSDFDVAVLVGVNWTVQAPHAFVERARLWLGGRILGPT
jgi:hypothetical protein